MSHPPHVETISSYFRSRDFWKEFSWWQRIMLRRNCRKNGGHWWHLIPGCIIDWYCCNCPAETDGMPQDGSDG